MPTPTYTPLANITLSGSAASVSFSSISGSYRDLILVCDNVNASIMMMSLNSSTSGWSRVEMLGNGSSAQSYTDSTNQVAYISGGGGNYNVILQVMDYTATDKHKTVLIRYNAPGYAVGGQASRWATTSAVTAMSVYPSSGTFSAGASFSLYGVAA